MPIVVQSKGLEHIRSLRKNAAQLYDIMRHCHSWEDCIKMAMEDHVRLLEAEQALRKREEIYNCDECE